MTEYYDLVDKGFQRGFGLAQFGDEERRKRLSREQIAVMEKEQSSAPTVGDTARVSNYNAALAAQDNETFGEGTAAAADYQYGPQDKLATPRGLTQTERMSRMADIYRNNGFDDRADKFSGLAYQYGRDERADARQSVADARDAEKHPLVMQGLRQQRELGDYQVSAAKRTEVLATEMEKLRVASQSGWDGLSGLIDNDPNDDKHFTLGQTKNGMQILVNGKPVDSQVFKSPDELAAFMQFRIKNDPDGFVKSRLEQDSKRAAIRKDNAYAGYLESGGSRGGAGGLGSGKPLQVKVPITGPGGKVTYETQLVEKTANGWVNALTGEKADPKLFKLDGGVARDPLDDDLNQNIEAVRAGKMTVPATIKGQQVELSGPQAIEYLRQETASKKAQQAAYEEFTQIEQEGGREAAVLSAFMDAKRQLGTPDAVKRHLATLGVSDTEVRAAATMVEQKSGGDRRGQSLGKQVMPNWVEQVRDKYRDAGYRN
jgi:hypothetical protein